MFAFNYIMYALEAEGAIKINWFLFVLLFLLLLMQVLAVVVAIAAAVV